jgi:hypothetical protein
MDQARYRCGPGSAVLGYQDGRDTTLREEDFVEEKFDLKTFPL